MLTFFLFLILSPLTFVLVVLAISNILRNFQKPRLDREWIHLHEKTPSIRIENEKVKIHNIRDARYDSRGMLISPNFSNAIYNLNDLEAVWIYINPFAPGLSHTMLSFQFKDRFLVSSAEVRKVDVTSFNIFKTLYQNFEIFYALGTEQDFFFTKFLDKAGVNTAYLYKLELSKQEVHAVFHNLVNIVNDYSVNPKFYRTTHRNCLTETFKVFDINGKNILGINPLTFVRTLQFFYNLKQKHADRIISYSDFKRLGNITDIESNLSQDDLFSFKIRKNYFELA